MMVGHRGIFAAISELHGAAYQHSIQAPSLQNLKYHQQSSWVSSTLVFPHFHNNQDFMNGINVQELRAEDGDRREISPFTLIWSYQQPSSEGFTYDIHMSTTGIQFD